MPPHLSLARTISLTAAAALVLASSACSDETNPQVTLTISAIAASNNQSAIAGAILPLPLRVLVEEDGLPKPGVTISWSASAGGLKPAASVTDAQGIAATVWTLGASPGPMSATAALTGANGSPVTFHAAALNQARMTVAIEGGDTQTGQVGAPLPLPLRVKVHTFGPSDAGVTVTWSATDGHVSPASSITDLEGFAETHWTLDTVARDTQVVVAQVHGAEGSPLQFTARALPGSVSTLTPAMPDTQVAYTGAAYTTGFDMPALGLLDRYGNAVPNQPVTWSVAEGPIHIASSENASDEIGFARVEVAPDGPAGTGVVEAVVDGSPLSKRFTFSIRQEHFVVLRVNDGTFTSAQNGSTPAVDTIPAGTTMRWFLEDWDYDYHAIVPVGTPSFPSQPIGYRNSGLASITFTTPGTYQYQDDGVSGASGTLVVQ
jgi:adhesin/invasin